MKKLLVGLSLLVSTMCFAGATATGQVTDDGGIVPVAVASRMMVWDGYRVAFAPNGIVLVCPGGFTANSDQQCFDDHKNNRWIDSLAYPIDGFVPVATRLVFAGAYGSVRYVVYYRRK